MEKVKEKQKRESTETLRLLRLRLLLLFTPLFLVLLFSHSLPPFPIPPNGISFLTRLFLFFYSLGLIKKGVEQSGDAQLLTIVVILFSCTVACTPLTLSPSPARCHGLCAPTFTGTTQPLSSWDHIRSSSLPLPLLLFLLFLSISHTTTFSRKKEKNSVVVPSFSNIFRHRSLKHA